MATESWQEKFYKLADFYMESETRLLIACGKLSKTRAELTGMLNELSEKQRESFRTAPRLVIDAIIEGRGTPKMETFTAKAEKVIAAEKNRKALQQAKILKRVLENQF